MAATTTQYHPYSLGYEEKLTVLAANTSQYIHSASVVGLPTSIMGTTFGPFQMVTTAADCIHVPMHSSNSKIAGFLIFEGVSSDCYPVLAVRVPPDYSTTLSPDGVHGLPWREPMRSTGALGMGLRGGQSSAADSGWKLITTTVQSYGTSTKAWMYATPILETAKYGIVAASSGANVDKYQPYFEFQLGVTTAKVEGGTSTNVGLHGQGIHWSTFSTTQPITNYGSTACQHYYMFLEIP